MSSDFQVVGGNARALFTLKLHRGEGMCLLAMNWRSGQPPRDFVGFAIEYKEPGGDKFFALKNRLTFPGANGEVNPNALSTRLSPIQKFRWVHFPRNAEMSGDFTYRVTPVFMNPLGELSYGDEQQAAIALRRETYPGQLNVTFTRGFVSSQAFVDRYDSQGPISTLLPAKAADGLTFKPTHPDAQAALKWMGFEARSAIYEMLDKAKADGALVQVVAYDLSEAAFVAKLVALGDKLRIIIDDSGDHGEDGSGENQAEAKLKKSAGAANVKRQHMGNLQHNKMIIVDGPNVKQAVGGSTNYSWRGFYVQANNAVIVTGASAIAPFKAAFAQYWASDKQGDFGASPPALWSDLGLNGIDAKVTFSPHSDANAQLTAIANDIATTQSSLLYSLAFLYQTDGPIKTALAGVTGDASRFVYGISDRKVGGLDVEMPDGNVATVYPSALSKNVPSPFHEEVTGGGGIRMHHKFVVIDFDKPTARVYLGSYNFSNPADVHNGENLFLFKDRRIVTAYMVEALRLFDHYHYRVISAAAKKTGKPLQLATPPKLAGQKPWFAEDYAVAHKIKDREIFA